MSGYAGITSTWKRLITDRRGFSLPELLVVMGIFVTVMMITASTFKIIANSTSQQAKSLETQIEGVVGLEILRSDLEQTGFGLPTTFQNTTLSPYVESAMGSNMPTSSYWPSGDPSTNFNDAPSGIPRPILSADTNFNIASGVGAKYLVIKATTAAANDVAKRWTNVYYAAGVAVKKTWNDAVRDFAATDRVMVVKNNLMSNPTSRQLMVSPAVGGVLPAGTYSAPFSSFTTLMQPHTDGDTFQVYGLSRGSIAPKMPFNRTDYYVYTPSGTNMPQGCAPHTGVLYKSNISHSSGGYDPIMPLLDCVADMQIVYGLDTVGTGNVNFHTTAAPASADMQRSQIKEIRVYLLAQDGKKDITFKYPSSTVDVGESFDGGATLVGRSFNLATLIGGDWQNYRWKVYTIVVRPKNLIQ